MFKPGDTVYSFDFDECDDYYNAEVCGYLYMGECNEYIIACSEYMGSDFEEQLYEMYEESVEDGEVGVILLRKELCFDSCDEANDYLAELIDE